MRAATTRQSLPPRDAIVYNFDPAAATLSRHPTRGGTVMGNPNYTLTLFTAIACGVTGLMMILARRGRRIDDHPLCRKCGFDLFGLPGTSHNCPECGRDLRRRRATRIGHRQRHRPLLRIL